MCAFAPSDDRAGAAAPVCDEAGIFPDRPIKWIFDVIED